MFRFFVVLALIFTPKFSFAYDDFDGVDPQIFREWRLLTAQLTSDGIAFEELNSQETLKLCAGFNYKSAGTLYNKCRYKVVKNYTLHKSNKKSCEIAALEQYPDSFLKSKVTELRKSSGFDSNNRTKAVSGMVDSRVISVSSEPLSKLELNSLRLGFVSKCMLDKGWNDSEDWRLGRK